MLNGLIWAWRRLRRRPWTSLIAVGLLGIGAGVSAGLWQISAVILGSPLPFSDPGQLVQINLVRRNSGSEERQEYLTYEQFQALREQTRSFQCLSAGKEAGHGNAVYLTGVNEPQRLRASQVSSNFFDCLGVKPLLGAGLRGVRPDSVWAAHSLWVNHLGASSEAVGKTIQLNGSAHVLAGVMPPILQEDGSEAIHGDRVDLWQPLPRRKVAGEVAYRIIGRLKPGLSPASANSELHALLNSPEADFGLWRGASGEITSLKEEVVGAARRYLWVLNLAGLILLALTLVNVMGFQLVRAEIRSHDAAIQEALGARHLHLNSETVAEILFLSAAAGVPAWFCSRATLAAFLVWAPAETPRLDHPGLRDVSETMIVGLVLSAAALLGIVLLKRPAADSGLTSRLRHGAATLTSSHAWSRFREKAILIETAAAVSLLFSTALLYQSFARVNQVQPGFATAGVYSIDVFLPRYRYQGERAALFYEELRESLEALPEIESVAITSSPPLAPRDYFGAGGWSIRRVGHRYFDLLRIPILAGRGFRKSESGKEPSAVISRSLAARLFPETDPIGERLGHYHIIGVVEDTRHVALDEQEQPALYVSHRQEPDTRMSLLVKVRKDAAGVRGMITSRVRQLDPEQPVSAGVALDKRALESSSMIYRRLFLGLLGTFALVALLLCVTGFYALIAQSVQQRSGVLALRMVLGAGPGDILLLVMGQTWRLALTGVLWGLLGAFWLSGLQASLLYEISPHDPETLVLVVALLLIVASFGSLIPALRAARLEPARLLRTP